MVARRSASAPGSLMLLGEHAVLHGYPCLVAAINRRVKVELTPRNDHEVHIESALGSLITRHGEFPAAREFRFVLGTLQHIPAAYPDGVNICINADMPPTIGFGTSAAVTVAMVAACTGSNDKSLIMQTARSIIQSVQGRGSGADVAASTFGGVVRYKINDASGTIISRHHHPVTALYCGYKTPTPEVIERVEQTWKHRGAERDALFRSMGELADLDLDDHFGHRLNEAQELMQTLGVSTPELDQCIHILRKSPGILGAKISGSGLGDCAIGWGEANIDASLPKPFELYRLQVESYGVEIE